mgnify:FL=1|tara:strand:+ start:11765 stop:12382 length:618 start_codon:yes stop_codon:yes gene_type:complete
MNLILKSLNFSYEKEEVLKDINFNFQSGVLNIVSGESGVGKTSLLNLIAGLERPSSGSIVLDNITQADSNHFIEPEKRNIGFVFQDFALFPHMNIESNITFAGESDNKFFNRLVRRMSLADHLKKYPHEISGGQQQRVSIARALFSKPKILLVDEPISNQDKENKNEIIKIISEFIKNQNIICIIVSHDEIHGMSNIETRHFVLS